MRMPLEYDSIERQPYFSTPPDLARSTRATNQGNQISTLPHPQVAKHLSWTKILGNTGHIDIILLRILPWCRRVPDYRKYIWYLPSMKSPLLCKVNTNKQLCVRGATGGSVCVGGENKKNQNALTAVQQHTTPRPTHMPS